MNHNETTDINKLVGILTSIEGLRAELNSLYTGMGTLHRDLCALLRIDPNENTFDEARAIGLQRLGEFHLQTRTDETQHGLP